MIRAIVVDDEEPARQELCFLLSQHDDIEVVAQAANGLDALDQIRAYQPDLVFLDIQMPGRTGFEVARELVVRDDPTHIVFVTAYDQHAIEAFEVNAVDYLLKPVDSHRLRGALNRVRQRLAPLQDRGPDHMPRAELQRIVAQLARSQRPAPEQVALRVGERFHLISSDDIIYASLADDVITIVTRDITGTSNYRTLDELQSKLNPETFWRVHRSHVVNINQVKEIVPWFSRNYLLKMKDSKATEIPVSRAQTKRLREYLSL